MYLRIVHKARSHPDRCPSADGAADRRAAWQRAPGPGSRMSSLLSFIRLAARLLSKPQLQGRTSDLYLTPGHSFSRVGNVQPTVAWSRFFWSRSSSYCFCLERYWRSMHEFGRCDLCINKCRSLPGMHQNNVRKNVSEDWMNAGNLQI